MAKHQLFISDGNGAREWTVEPFDDNQMAPDDQYYWLYQHSDGSETILNMVRFRKSDWEKIKAHVDGFLAGKVGHRR